MDRVYYESFESIKSTAGEEEPKFVLEPAFANCEICYASVEVNVYRTHLKWHRQQKLEGKS